MNVQQARNYLDRINRLFGDIAQNDQNSSALERDLLKEYVRRLYESLSEVAVENPSQQSNPKTSTATASPTSQTTEVTAAPTSPQKASLVDTPAFTFEPTPAPAPAPEIRPEVPPVPTPVAAKPKIIEVPREVEADIEQLQQHNSTRQNSSATTLSSAAPSIAQASAEISSPFSPSPATIDPKLKEIFALERSTDLSERLAGAPIADLTKALAINERLLTQNDLFGGNKSAFDEALAHLNTLHSYEEAVSYLAGGVALQHDWSQEEIRPTARAFVKLVRRRYP